MAAAYNVVWLVEIQLPSKECSVVAGEALDLSEVRCRPARHLLEIDGGDGIQNAPSRIGVHGLQFFPMRDLRQSGIPLAHLATLFLVAP